MSRLQQCCIRCSSPTKLLFSPVNLPMFSIAVICSWTLACLILDCFWNLLTVQAGRAGAFGFTSVRTCFCCSFFGTVCLVKTIDCRQTRAHGQYSRVVRNSQPTEKSGTTIAELMQAHFSHDSCPEDAISNASRKTMFPCDLRLATSVRSDDGLIWGRRPTGPAPRRR